MTDREISYIECILRYCKIIEDIQIKNNKDYTVFDITIYGIPDLESKPKNIYLNTIMQTFTDMNCIFHENTGLYLLNTIPILPI